RGYVETRARPRVLHARARCAPGADPLRVTGAPLRIAHVTGEHGFSGGEVQVFLLMEGLRARGHATLLGSPPDSRPEREARRRGFAVECVAMRSDLSVGAALRVAALLRRRAPALVHCHTGRAHWVGGRG